MLVRMRSSALRPGSILASEPVARITFFAFTWLASPLAVVTSTVCTPSLRRAGQPSIALDSARSCASSSGSPGP